MLKIWSRFQKWKKKNSEKDFCFSNNCISLGSGKFSQSWTRYLSSAYNVLTNTHKISPNTKGSNFQINFPENDKKTWEKCSHGDFASIWDAFTCWLSKRVLKQGFLENGLSKFFAVCNFGNTLDMTIIFSFRTFKMWCRFQKWNKKFSKSFSFSRYLHLNWEWQILAILNRIDVIGSQCVKKHP